MSDKPNLSELWFTKIAEKDRELESYSVESKPDYDDIMKKYSISDDRIPCEHTYTISKKEKYIPQTEFWKPETKSYWINGNDISIAQLPE